MKSFLIMYYCFCFHINSGYECIWLYLVTCVVFNCFNTFFLNIFVNTCVRLAHIKLVPNKLLSMKKKKIIIIK